MRVISGFAKGKKLFAPKDQRIRPTSDRVKESVFNMLAFQLRGRIFVDLFCGSGAMGIEALSRGCSKAYFFDQSKESIALTKKNLEHCSLSSQYWQAEVLEAAQGVEWLHRHGVKGDFFYLDPPYAMEHPLKLVQQILDGDLLTEEGIILLEHDANRNPCDEESSIQPVDQRKYGKTGILFFRKQVMT